MRAFLFLIILAVVLFIFNPNRNDFDEFIENKTSEYFQSEVDDSKLGESLAQLGGSLSSLLADQVTVHKNYYLFSTYIIDLDGRDQHDAEWRFLGIGGQFFELQHPDDD